MTAKHPSMDASQRAQLQQMQEHLAQRLERDAPLVWSELLASLATIATKNDKDATVDVDFDNIGLPPDSSLSTSPGSPLSTNDKVTNEEALAQTLDTDLFDQEIPQRTSQVITPRLFGDYELLDELGRGGMGVVWRARQRSLGRIVALKMLLPSARPSSDMIKRFHQEAKAVASLQHPHIVTIHEVGEHEGTLFFSMDCIQGQELGTALREGPLEPKRAARIIKALADTIHYTHQQGVIHRDLKPSNILCGIHDAITVTDFGIAKWLNSDQEITRTGTIVGTPGYMAPELLSGKSAAVSAACDIYGIGAVLYKLLTCRAPYEGENPIDILQQSLESAPLPSRLLNQKIPEDLEAICLKCLEREPRDRYETAQALAEDLQAFLEGSPVNASQRNAFSHIARLLLRDTEHTNLITSWSPIWRINGIQLLIMFALTQILYLSGQRNHTLLAAVWLVGFLSLVAVVWWHRLREPKRFSPLEHQMTKIWFIAAFNFLSIAVLNAQMRLPSTLCASATGGNIPLPDFYLMPLILLEAGVAFACMAVVLGGEFFVMAIPCVLLAHISIYFPDWIFGIVGVAIAMGMLLPFWKYGNKAAPKGKVGEPRADDGAA